MTPSTPPTRDASRPGRAFQAVGLLAVLWNVMGVASYLMSVTQGPDALQAVPEAERVLYEDIPAWVTSAYAVAVFGGLLGSILLLARRALAVPVFWVSLAAILAQMVHAFFLTPMLQLQGPASAALPVTIIVIGAVLVGYARSARGKGWLR
jgi:hypothetical protein